MLTQDVRSEGAFEMKSSEVKYPMTPAIQFLKDNDIDFYPHLYRYVERGGTSVSSKELGLSESKVIKTLIFEKEDKQPIVMLMHGDKQVSLKELARQIGCKVITPCLPEVAQRHSGYQVGGTSPFGLRKKMPIYMEATVGDLDEIYINGGGRGLLVRLRPPDLIRVLNPKLVTVAQAK